jgi:hypothetical protein
MRGRLVDRGLALNQRVPVRRTRAGPEMPAHQHLRASRAPRSELALDDPAGEASPAAAALAQPFPTALPLFTRARAIAWSVVKPRLRRATRARLQASSKVRPSRIASQIVRRASPVSFDGRYDHEAILAWVVGAETRARRCAPR